MSGKQTNRVRRGIQRGALPPPMDDRRNRGEMHLPVASEKPSAEVDFLEIEKEPLVESADRFEGAAPESERGSYHPRRRARGIVRPRQVEALPDPRNPRCERCQYLVV